MTDPAQPFEKLLEQYIFSVAANFIDRADLEGQSTLISLINRVNASSMPAENAINLIPNSSANSFTSHLEAQWQEALSLPITPKDRSRNERKKNSQRLMAVHQIHIDTTRSSILNMEKLIERAGKAITDTGRQSKLIKRYQSIKSRYVAYLAKVQALQQQEFNRLQCYEQSLDWS